MQMNNPHNGRTMKHLSFFNKLFIGGFVLYAGSCLAAERTIDLVVAYKTVNFAGKSIKTIAFNNQIPGPTLHFREGDHVTINVHNHLEEGTSVHWHGLIVPWKMDGVDMVTQDPIPPGDTFHYQFTIKQSGTYWYHAHAGLQEQEGLYGALIIDPLSPPSYHYDKDYVIVLSDWSNTPANHIYKNLKRDGDYYSPKFPLQPSLTHFLQAYKTSNVKEQAELKAAYWMMQRMRMSPYDFSDVAYDAFLMNGHPKNNPWQGDVKEGDVVRLRFIDAGASSIFRIKLPGTLMQLVHVQGHDIVPFETDNLTLSPGETYDVLVKIKRSTPYPIYAESLDQVGAAYGALVTSSHQWVDFSAITPFPTPKPRMMMHSMDMSGMRSPSSSHPNMPEKAPQPMAMNPSMEMNSTNMTHHQNISMTPMDNRGMSPQYQSLKSFKKTNDPNKPVKIVKLVLSGYMDRYIWFINGVPEYKSKPMILEHGKRYRFIFVNNSMMDHPMHVHGHWFILRNGHGAYDPLLHTIHVQPNETITVDMDANADGGGTWYFHCHNLYHMRAGMAMILQYSSPKFSTKDSYSKTSDVQNTSKMHGITGGVYPTAHPALWYNANWLEGGTDFTQTMEGTFKLLLGPDYDKLQLYSEDFEVKKGNIENANMDIFYWHLMSQFWAIKGGANYVYRPAQRPYIQPGIGIEGLAPFFIDTNVRVYAHAGSVKFNIDLSRDNQLGDNFFIRTGIRTLMATKTVPVDEVGSGFNQLQLLLRPYYRIRPGLNIYTEYNHSENYGALKKILKNENKSAQDNTWLLGLAVIF